MYDTGSIERNRAARCSQGGVYVYVPTVNRDRAGNRYRGVGRNVGLRRHGQVAESELPPVVGEAVQSRTRWDGPIPPVAIRPSDSDQSDQSGRSAMPESDASDSDQSVQEASSDSDQSDQSGRGMSDSDQATVAPSSEGEGVDSDASGRR